MGRTRFIAAVAAGLLIIAVGCTTSKEDADEPTTTTSTSLPLECEGVIAGGGAGDATSSTDDASSDTAEGDVVVPEATTTLPPKCADAVFAEIVQASGSEELLELSPESQLAFGHGMCAYSLALGANPGQMPTYTEMVSSTAASWQVSENIVEEVIGLAGQLCPGQMKTVTDLRDGATKVELDLSVTGTGRAQVSYSLPGGGSFREEVAVPWMHEATIDSPVDFGLTARIPDGEATCTIKVGDTIVVEQTAGTGEDVSCVATASELRDAAR